MSRTAFDFFFFFQRRNHWVFLDNTIKVFKDLHRCKEARQGQSWKMEHGSECLWLQVWAKRATLPNCMQTQRQIYGKIKWRKPTYFLKYQPPQRWRYPPPSWISSHQILLYRSWIFPSPVYRHKLASTTGLIATSSSCIFSRLCPYFPGKNSFSRMPIWSHHSPAAHSSMYH